MLSTNQLNIMSTSQLIEKKKLCPNDKAFSVLTLIGLRSQLQLQ